MIKNKNFLIIKNKSAFWFASIPVIWTVIGFLSTILMVLSWGGKGHYLAIQKSIMAIPIILSILIGFVNIRSLFVQTSKGSWIAAVLGLSVLPPLLLHIFYGTGAESFKDIWLPFVYVSIGGLIPFYTMGLIFPSLAPFIAAFLMWSALKEQPHKHWQTFLWFLVFSFCWEITLFTGQVMGNGG